MIIHVIEPGDTIFSIANYYRVPSNWIIRENDIGDPFNLVIGSSIVILYPKIIHQVVEGDTLESIASMYNIIIMDLLRYNSVLSDQEFLIVGEILVIEYTDEKISEVSVVGYSYPFIDEDILRKTLPYLSFLIINSLSIGSNGIFIDEDDAVVVEHAKAYGVAPIMQITLAVEKDNIGSDIAHIVLNNEYLKNNIIETIINNVLEKGYAGIGIIPTYIFPSDRRLYIEFISEIIGRIKELGLIVFNTLIPNTFELISDPFVTQEYVKTIDKLADNSILFPTSVGLVIGAPIGTSNYVLLQEVLSYTLLHIPEEELSLGISTVGYIWELPYISGVSEGHAISAETAYNLARDYGISIQFDEGTQVAYFIFRDNNRESLVRFRDARTVVSYMQLVDAYNLAGVGIWNIMDYFNQLWLIINSQYNIYKVDN